MNASAITNKVYRYDALLQAIDFFTQRFSVDQLTECSFEFANEILTLNASALLVREGNSFVLKKKRVYSVKNYAIKDSSKLQGIATFYGNVITENFDFFFSEEDILFFKMKLVIPLIIDDVLVGLIISDGKAIGKFEDDDLGIAVALMRLFNNSMENSRNFSELKDKNKQLDQKIFNLFAINQSSKSLLSELDLEKLYSMATDVFSEIACSKVTSFGVYDELTNQIKIVGYRNVNNYNSYYTELKLKSSINDNMTKIVLNVNDDLKLIKDTFYNWEELITLEAKYIVLIIKEKLLGLVTLGEPVNEAATYDNSTFELIESLASFTYIAFSNALLFKEIKEQKLIIEKKFKMLSNLNALIKNINHCVTMEELCDITLKTLQSFFGIKTAFIAFSDTEGYRIKDCIGEVKGDLIYLNECWFDATQGETIYDFSKSATSIYFDETVQFQNSNCLVISPVLLEHSTLTENQPLAYLVVTETTSNLKEEQILLIDTITKNITPILYHMNTTEKENGYQNNKQKFLHALEEKIMLRDKLNLDFYIAYKRVDKNPFQKFEPHEVGDYENYIVENYIFVISNEAINIPQYTQIPSLSTIDEFLNFKF
ncbi:hypothetical protein RH915_02470 [Serpentinicella sp. ANB-PHB4]|uniref:hypothetical protein n=1 Tax=Serpentinicella sp. ANB-PHB4 TaxID=3074076 RepID=UPI002858383D|nr:hypothetical protein [Serpentinicella sp. ANB-PHB4]MDR5658347.1 hypothetical protein [Serpentinicella sp. ANB-PHB4]